MAHRKCISVNHAYMTLYDYGDYYACINFNNLLLYIQLAAAKKDNYTRTDIDVTT